MVNKKVVEKALSLVGQGYIYGAKGQTCSLVFRQQQAAQYPEQADNILGTGAKWDGKPVWDCAQLTRVCAKEGGVSLVSGATSQWKKTMWEKCGTIGTLPAGETVFLYRRQEKNSDVMQHTGVALGDGTCVHARGTAYGVVRQQVDEYPWTHWARPEWPSEEEGSKLLYMAKVVAQSGSTVRLRKFPNSNAAIVARVPVGSIVGVISEMDEWAEIELSDGTEGYMMVEFLQNADDSTQQPQEGWQEGSMDEDEVTLTLPKEVAEALLEALRRVVMV